MADRHPFRFILVGNRAVGASQTRRRGQAVLRCPLAQSPDRDVVAIAEIKSLLNGAAFRRVRIAQEKSLAELGIREQRLDTCFVFRADRCAGCHDQKEDKTTSKQAHVHHRISLMIAWRSFGASMGGLLKWPCFSLW